MLEVVLIIGLIVLILWLMWPLLVLILGIGLIYYILTIFGIAKKPTVIRRAPKQEYTSSRPNRDDDVIDVDYTVTDKEDTQ